MADARFEDGGEAPLYLAARDAEDLGVIAALVQDAVFPVTEMRWDRQGRRFALLLNRFRWEDREAAAKAGRAYERVRSLLVVDEVQAVRSQGVTRAEKDLVLSLLDVSWEPGEDGTGHVLLTLAGDGAIRLSVEALEVTLKDVTRPYVAPSHRAPTHPE
jgi:dipeptidyl aminopeptidase/acylaminoacyl peptidase